MSTTPAGFYNQLTSEKLRLPNEQELWNKFKTQNAGTEETTLRLQFNRALADLYKELGNVYMDQKTYEPRLSIKLYETAVSLVADPAYYSNLFVHIRF